MEKFIAGIVVGIIIGVPLGILASIWLVPCDVMILGR